MEQDQIRRMVRDLLLARRCAERAAAVYRGGTFYLSSLGMLSLRCDHRVMFGAEPARFLADLVKSLSESAERKTLRGIAVQPIAGGLASPASGRYPSLKEII